LKSWQHVGDMKVNELSPSEFPVCEEQKKYEGKKRGKRAKFWRHDIIMKRQNDIT